MDKRHQDFIVQHLNDNTDRLLLNASRFPDISMPEVVHQINMRHKSKSKLPIWSKNLNTIFPSKISYEQASSEATARFKASLFTGKTFADLTGGFGVDAYFFAQRFQSGFYVEKQAELHHIAQHNYRELHCRHIDCHHTDAEVFLQQLIPYSENKPSLLDLIYIDPARRNKHHQKVFRLAECQPDVVRLLPKLLKCTSNILLKTSPMSDISFVTSELKNVQKAWVIAVENECKEVLFWISRDKQPSNLPICAVNLGKDRTQIFHFNQLDEAKVQVRYALPDQFLFRPNTAVLKAGAFKTIAHTFDIHKLHPNTHLYTATTPKHDFVGKTYYIRHVCKYTKRSVIPHLSDRKANIATMNFPDSPALVRKKLGLKDGGNQYIFGITDKDNKKIILITTLVKY